MEINEERIRAECGSVAALLAELGYTTNTYAQLKNKKTDSFKRGSKSWELYKILREKGYTK